jgi:putative phosphotransacetylase
MSKLVSVPVGVSSRHLHVTRETLDVLYGDGYQLRPMKDISQPGQFASYETVDLVTAKNTFRNVRILGPERKQTQIELSLTDAFELGIKPPVRTSGDLQGTPGITIVGPKGSVALDEGVIIVARHIHMTPADAARVGATDHQIVKVLCEGERGLIFDHVLVRVSEKSKYELHVDTDEGNAAMLKTGELVQIML